MPSPRSTDRILATTSPDPILHHIAPLGLAASAGACLVVDLDPSAPPLAGRSLAELADRGLSSDELRPDGGVAVLGNGGIRYEDAAPVLDALAGRWPRIVLRSGGEDVPVPVVRILPLLPAPFRPDSERCVLQATMRGQRGPAGVTLLPPLRRTQIQTMLAGSIEPRWRWVRAFGHVWGSQWA